MAGIAEDRQLRVSEMLLHQSGVFRQQIVPLAGRQQRRNLDVEGSARRSQSRRLREQLKKCGPNIALNGPSPTRSNESSSGFGHWSMWHMWRYISSVRVAMYSG